MNHRTRFLPVLFLASLILTIAIPAAAQEVWSGYDLFFEKVDGADWTDPENQDRITDNVWITRQATRGIFNLAQEASYVKFVSPVDTEWAFGNAVDWQSLAFECWECFVDSYPPGLLGQEAVVHLITDDIYIDIRFESFTASAGGGGFSYYRSSGDSTPTEESTWGSVKATYR